MRSTMSDEEFIALWQQGLTVQDIATRMGITLRNVFVRRRKVEQKYGIVISLDQVERPEEKPQRIEYEIENGTAIVFSDAHFWNTTSTTAYRGLIYLIKKLKPQLIVCNGDAFDGASISRFPRAGFHEQKPMVSDELRACKTMLGGIVKAAPKDCLFTWPLGNHDMRFEAFLAANAPQFEFIDGFHLKDHFPEWDACWSTWINDDVVIKHRWKGGIHATHNNTVNSGKTMVTGHLHSLKVTPFSDYNGTRWGVDTGTLAEPYGPQFRDYCEDNPVNWRSGFAVLTWEDGQLLPPELCQVWDDDSVTFRGEVIGV